ncbi:3889_t:CDS:2 [Cetraspora pellucida]|uniref:3889_t:CDS:1 n=1 Tax=Cetraspora pellucida TaxID=1433469 RepID=A0A9N9H9C9_9GLOM|nr:3889_t:CDS:2 [Cetraspora pellucida]
MSVNTSKELLDFEDCQETIIEKKIVGLLKMKTKNKSSNKRPTHGKLETFPLEPPSDLYSRITEFLSEDDEERQIFNVKHIEENDKKLIVRKEPGNLKTFPLKPPIECNYFLKLAKFLLQKKANLSTIILAIVYSRVKEFLPRIASTNKQLLKKDQTSINIEHIEDDTEYVIEWDLGVGVFEHKKEPSEDDIIVGSSSKPKGITFKPVL